jgi:hypothetical protein
MDHHQRNRSQNYPRMWLTWHRLDGLLAQVEAEQRQSLQCQTSRSSLASDPSSSQKTAAETCSCESAPSKERPGTMGSEASEGSTHLSEMSLQELQEIVHLAIKGVNSGRLSPREADRINEAAKLVMRAAQETHYPLDVSPAVALLRGAYEKLSDFQRSASPPGGRASAPGA